MLNIQKALSIVLCALALNLVAIKNSHAMSEESDTEIAESFNYKKIPFMLLKAASQNKYIYIPLALGTATLAYCYATYGMQTDSLQNNFLDPKVFQSQNGNCAPCAEFWQIFSEALSPDNLVIDNNTFFYTPLTDTISCPFVKENAQFFVDQALCAHALDTQSMLSPAITHKIDDFNNYFIYEISFMRGKPDMVSTYQCTADLAYNSAGFLRSHIVSLGSGCLALASALTARLLGVCARK